MTNEDKNANQTVNSDVKTPSKKPDDLGNIQIDCYVKIFDPNTEEVMMESRA